MRHLALLLVAAASSLTACTPKTCDPQPIPAEHQAVAQFLPASAVVCGVDDKKKGLQLNFSERDTTKVMHETMLKLAKDNWSLGKTQVTDQFLQAWKGSLYLTMNVNTHNGGPNVGRVTGQISVVDMKK